MRREITSVPIQTTGAAKVHIPLNHQKYFDASMLEKIDTLPPEDPACWNDWSEWDSRECPHANFRLANGTMTTCGIGYVQSRMRRTNGNPQCAQSQVNPAAEYNSAPCLVNGAPIVACIDPGSQTLQQQLGHAWGMAFQNTHAQLNTAQSLYNTWKDQREPQFSFPTNTELESFRSSVTDLKAALNALKVEAQTNKESVPGGR